MKSILFAALAFASALTAQAYSHKEEVTRNVPFTATGTLVLKNVNGDVEITTWDKNEVRIEAVKSAKTEEELKLIDLRIEESPERVAIEVKLPRRSGGLFGKGNIRAAVEFKITLPATAELKDVSTVNGTLRITGVTGGIHASSVNGGLVARDIGGRASLSSVNGGIEARIAKLTDGRLEAETVNGGISFHLPAELNASVDASVVNGNVACDFPIQLSGRVSGRHIKGVIGTGPGTVKASTVNGSIRIQKS